MRYFTVTADYCGTGLKDDFSGFVSPESLNLPTELAWKISQWVTAYQAVIQLDESERSRRHKEIEHLDKEGLAISREFKIYFGEDAKVQYYSEGKLQKIPF